MDTDAALHRQTFFDVLAGTGLEPQLVEALYTVESDSAHTPFAEDAVRTLTALRHAGLRLAVLSDIHFDLRPAFADAGLAGVIDVLVLSFEQGITTLLLPPWSTQGSTACTTCSGWSD